MISHGQTLEDFPWVLQYNKRDLSNVESIQEMETKLNFFNVPSFESTATQGNGVFPTLKEVIKQVVASVQRHIEGGQRMRA